jgi:hypothetical protein
VVVVQEIEEPDGDDTIMVMERSRPVRTNKANEMFPIVLEYKYQ